MKNLLLATALTLTTFTAFAQSKLEFDEATEMKCGMEAEKLGCKGTDSQITKCLELKKRSLSQDCRDMHNARMNVR